MRYYSFYFIALTSLLFLLSCDDDNDQKEKPKGVPVKSVKAVSCVDLSDRADWEFIVMSNKYTYTTNGNNIQAAAIDSPYYFKENYQEGSSVPLGEGPVIYLMAPGYYADIKTKDTAPTPPDIADQTTPEKLLKADLLSTYYYGDVSENLTDVELTHANALLDFELIGAPGAEVLVKSYMTITPYKESENNYKAIVLAEGGEYNAWLTVKIGGTNHTVSILDPEQSKSSPLPGDGYVKRDTHYKFTLEYDTDKKELHINNLSRTKWSEKYPLTLELKKTTIAEFKMFIGSPDGPVEISTDKMDPLQFWGDRMSYYPTRLQINDTETISRIPHNTDSDTFRYRLKGDSLFRYNPNVEVWMWAGLGDMYSIDYHIGYYRCKYFDPGFWGGMGIYRFQIGQDNYWATGSGLWGDAHSPDDLKQETDTIMWCNVKYTYTSPLWDY